MQCWRSRPRRTDRNKRFAFSPPSSQTIHMYLFHLSESDHLFEGLKYEIEFQQQTQLSYFPEYRSPGKTFSALTRTNYMYNHHTLLRKYTWGYGGVQAWYTVTFSSRSDRIWYWRSLIQQTELSAVLATNCVIKAVLIKYRQAIRWSVHMIITICVRNTGQVSRSLLTLVVSWVVVVKILSHWN